MQFYLVDGSVIEADPETAPREGIVCIKWTHPVHGPRRIFGYEFYYYVEHDQMWGGLFCSCMAEDKKANGVIVLDSGMTDTYAKYLEIMEVSKHASSQSNTI